MKMKPTQNRGLQHHSTSIRPISMPLEPLKGSHRISHQERVFIEAVERGDKPTVIRCLRGPTPVNVNCTNMLGRSAIQIAVDNENIEIVELLLEQEGVKIGDALLYAIREGVYKIVEMLIDHPSITLEMLGPDWCKSKHRGEESSDFSEDISPIILACHCNQFEILQLLLLRGASIQRPHQLSCSCKTCQEQVHEDSLRYSLLRINSYKALASPAWISLTSPDPILTAFKLSWELEKLALRENEFKDTYIELSEQCKKYACDLLKQCRSTDEVIAILNRESDRESDDDDNQGIPDKLNLSRLKLALKYEQKQFVAHPHCQQLLTSIWYDGLPGWRKSNGLTKFFLCIGLITLVPFMSVYYLIFPLSKIGQMLRTPFMKFLYHSASFGVFLILLICSSTDISTSPNRGKSRGPPPSQLEWLILFWVMGFVWAECKQLWEEGLKAYIRQWWNWLDFIMLSLYLATFSLRFVAYLQIESGKYGPRELERQDWPIIDPTLLSEGLFAVANVFSFSRIIYLAQANQHLGPLQISLGCMIIDIVKFLFIFFLVLTSFACGMKQLYWYYNESRVEGDPDAFFSLGQSYVTLYWSLFGITAKNDLKVRNGQYFTELMGMLLFMAYHGMAIIVLTNMLIAMMSNSYQNIENHADMEWKFARSKLWMGYFEEGSTLPSPFNLIISPKSVYYFLHRCKCVLVNCVTNQNDGEGKYTSPSTVQPSTTSPYPVRIYSTDVFKTESSGASFKFNNTDSFYSVGTTKEREWNGDISNTNVSNDQRHYQDIMRRLVTRYIHQSKKQKQQNGVNEDDLLEIKQDISSLRYELREDRKHEAERSVSLLKDLKQELLIIISERQRTPVQTEYYACTNSPSNAVSNSNNFKYNFPNIDAEQLKKEILAEILSDIKRDVRDVIKSGDTAYSHTIPSKIPSIESELYQTHLYTQL